MTFDAREAGTPAATWLGDAGLRDLPPLPLPQGHVIVLAAHPDDETLGAGGLIAELQAHGRPPTVVIVTDGAASHAGRAGLAAGRADEVRTAVALLAPDAELVLLGHPDGQVRELRERVRAEIEVLVRRLTEPGHAPTTLVATWRGDGHRDHRVLGEIAAGIAEDLGTDLWEYPIWMWHWAGPRDERVPWEHLRALPVTEPSRELRRRAIGAHSSQLSGPHPVVSPNLREVLDRDAEAFVLTPRSGPDAVPDAVSDGVSEAAPSAASDIPVAYFEGKYARAEDPWGFTDRWYEERKRALTLASLPARRYGRALEVGCSIGVLTDSLAARADHLLAIDIAPTAVELARARLAGAPQVTLAVGDIADGVPEGPFDLVVLSEVLYYLSLATLRRVLGELQGELSEDAVVLACHWRHRVGDYPLGGDAVHRELAALPGLTTLARHEEEDFLLEVLARDPRSVGAKEGLV